MSLPNNSENRYDYYIHFTDEKAKTERLRRVPKVAGRVSDGAGPRPPPGLGWRRHGIHLPHSSAALRQEHQAPSQAYQCSEAFSAVGLGHAIGF